MSQLFSIFLMNFRNWSRGAFSAPQSLNRGVHLRSWTLKSCLFRWQYWKESSGCTASPSQLLLMLSETRRVGQRWATSSTWKRVSSWKLSKSQGVFLLQRERRPTFLKTLRGYWDKISSTLGISARSREISKLRCTWGWRKLSLWWTSWRLRIGTWRKNILRSWGKTSRTCRG